MLKNWFLALTLAGLAGAVVPAVVAQDAPAAGQQDTPAGAPPERGHGHGRFDPAQRAEMIGKKLNLSSDQQAKVADILKSEQSEMQKIHSDASTSQQDRRSKMMDSHKSSNDQIRAVLNADQQKKWDEMQIRHEQRMKNRQAGPPGAPDSDQK